MTRTLTVVGIVVVLLGAVAGGWVWFSARTANAVAVTWSATSPRCAGTKVHRRPSRSVIEAVKGMHCVIRVRISNNGSVGVHLDTATAPFVGAGTGTVVTASNADAASRYGVDARYNLGRSLGSGQTYHFDVVLRFHPSGCNVGGTFWVRGWPRVRVTVLGLVHERSAHDTFSFHRAGPTPGCAY